jgi:pimeloyl-ACP methyl ester carboxylesterase
MPEDELRQQAIVMATCAWQAAMMDGRIPGKDADWSLTESLDSGLRGVRQPLRAADALIVPVLDPVRMDWIREEEFNALDPRRLTLPTMILHGAVDPGVSSVEAGRYFARIASSQRQWTVLPGGDHGAQLEDTHDAFIRAVVEFVARR